MHSPHPCDSLPATDQLIEEMQDEELVVASSLLTEDEDHIAAQIRKREDSVDMDELYDLVLELANDESL
jgi:hypothetical protein